MAMAKILVCDSEQEWLTITGKILEQADYEVICSKNGRDALQKVRALKPDLIILDVKMPGMAGYEVCSILKSDPDLRNIPVIILTCMDMGDDFEKALDKKADGYVTKPFSEKHLLKPVRMLLREKEGKKTD
ncbi:MAG: response regulator [bacterium]